MSIGPIGGGLPPSQPPPIHQELHHGGHRVGEGKKGGGEHTGGVKEKGGHEGGGGHAHRVGAGSTIEDAEEIKQAKKASRSYRIDGNYDEGEDEQDQQKEEEESPPKTEKKITPNRRYRNIMDFIQANMKNH